MNDWQPMNTAPRDGTPIQAKIPGHGSDNIIAWLDGFLDAVGQDCCGWVFVEDQEPPNSWTDGICWESNEDDEPSVKPVVWKALDNNLSDSSVHAPNHGQFCNCFSCASYRK